MPSKEVERELRLLQNPTKLKVVVALSQGEAMTVTQMSKLIGVSRPNLYHFVSEMVAEGFLLRPTTKVSGNYVEKYYKLNEAAFEKLDQAAQHKMIENSTPAGYRDILKAVLLSISMNSRVLAEQLAEADPQTLSMLKARGAQVLAGYFTLGDEAYQEIVDGWKKLLAETMKKWEGKGEGSNRLAIYALPDLRGREGASRSKDRM